MQIVGFSFFFKLCSLVFRIGVTVKLLNNALSRINEHNDNYKKRIEPKAKTSIISKQEVLIISESNIRCYCNSLSSYVLKVGLLNK